MIPTESPEFDIDLPQPPLVCAYVITYDGKKFLQRCFETLQQRTDYENCRLILLDNGSSDGSGDYIRMNFPDVDVLRVFPNVGYPHGANKAIEDARRRGAKYIVLMNDDIAILHAHWLRDAVRYAESDPRIGIIGFAEVASDRETQSLPNAILTDVEYLSSPVMLIPIDVIDRIGLFDEVYYLIADENDLGARAQAAGFRIVRLDIPIYHFGGGAHQAYSRRTAYLQMRNGIRFCLKNRSSIRAVLRAAKMIDVACNPWPLTFDRCDAAHRRMRNSGNVFVNLQLWLRAVSWNILRLPQTLRIRAAERRLIAAARDDRQTSVISTQPRVNPVAAEQLTC